MNRWPALLRQPSFLVGLMCVVAFVVLGIFAPVLPLPEPVALDMTARLRPPSADHWLGTDSFGRDQLSRLIWGTRVSLLVGAASVLLGGSIGVLIGLSAGFFGARTDGVLMRAMDVILAFPTLILAMAITAALGPNLRNAVVAVALISVPTYARLVRSTVLKLKESEFVEAARALGASNSRLLFRHLLVNALGPIVVQGTLGFGQAILAVAGLSFIGLGAQPPTPEWGAMITEGRYYVLSGRWWLSVFPGLAIAFTVLGFNLVGDKLLDAIDPRSR